MLYLFHEQLTEHSLDGVSVPSIHGALAEALNSACVVLIIPWYPEVDRNEYGEMAQFTLSSPIERLMGSHEPAFYTALPEKVPTLPLSELLSEQVG